MFSAALVAFAVKAAETPKVEWGSMAPHATLADAFTATVAAPQERLALPAGFPHVVSVSRTDAPGGGATWNFNGDATSFWLELPAIPGAGGPVEVVLETTERSGQLADGRVVFSALDARVEGTSAKLESHPGNHRIGFWSSASDRVSWDFKPTRWGMYDVELAYSKAAGEGTEVFVDVGGRRVQAAIPPTGSWYRYRSLTLGRIHLDKQDPFTISVGCVRLTGGAVMNLKAVILRPAPEGPAPRQADDGSLTLLASQGISHSTVMRYEPQTNKNCFGYWVNQGDWAEWRFEVDHPGTYMVEVWQGCGKGHGGSLVQVEAGGRALPFTVEDTGHFQNFIPRQLGRVQLRAKGPQSLAIRPLKKQGGAVMDIQKIRLIPAADPDMGDGLASVHGKRVLFLGDSITYAGEYVEMVETWVRLRHPRLVLDLLNLGLPSETVSGLSEPGHAGGSFPRPTLHERLARALAAARPDWISACYGMNDGIYHPFSEDRFASFKDGMVRLRQAAEAAGVSTLHITPPVFDPLPIQGRTLPAGLPEYRSPYEGYNDVLDRYSDWLMSKKEDGWLVLDAHGPMGRFIAQKRKADPKFTLAGDGVHINTQGHWLIARELLAGLGAEAPVVESDDPAILLTLHPRAAEVQQWVREKQRLLKDAWLTRVGHVRPGMSKGKPFRQARAEAAALDVKIFEAVDRD